MTKTKEQTENEGLNSLVSLTCRSGCCSSSGLLVKCVLLLRFQLVLSWHMNAAGTSSCEFFGGLQALG